MGAACPFESTSRSFPKLSASPAAILRPQGWNNNTDSRVDIDEHELGCPEFGASSDYRVSTIKIFAMSL